MSELRTVTTGEHATAELAARLATRLRPGTVVALHGMLGAGKTSFVRGMASGMGLDPATVSSPTFVLWHEYGDRRLVHIDAYRVADPEELCGVGFDEMLDAGDAVVAVEWAERIESLLPVERIDVILEHGGDDRRAIAIRAPKEVLHDLVPVPVQCPICERTVEAGSENAPFCSPRCRMADLGKWLSNEYTIGEE